MKIFTQAFLYFLYFYLPWLCLFRWHLVLNFPVQERQKARDTPTPAPQEINVVVLKVVSEAVAELAAVAAMGVAVLEAAVQAEVGNRV